LTNVYPNNNKKKKNNKVKSKPLELYELAGKKRSTNFFGPLCHDKVGNDASKEEKDKALDMAKVFIHVHL
jgi:hypothetical protein